MRSDGRLRNRSTDAYDTSTTAFYAGYASSAVVQATVYVPCLVLCRDGCRVEQEDGAHGGISRNFWGYFEPIRQSMPANCSADIGAVIAHVDSVLQANVSSDVTALKQTFGLEGLAHNDDFAAARKH